jgi:hypothetical protein
VFDLDPLSTRSKFPAAHKIRVVISGHHGSLPSPSISAGKRVDDDTIASAM